MNAEGKAFCAASAGAMALYAWTLAPTVTLEFSGSLACAADYMGVANSPGYPVWTLIAWLFQGLFGLPASLESKGHAYENRFFHQDSSS